jgi:hypothetical protein
MNQRTHSWIAIRSIALLEDRKEVKNLVKLLKPMALLATIGAWVPDDIDAKRGGSGSSTDNHILKIEPIQYDPAGRFVCRKADLLNHIGDHRKAYEFLSNDSSLDDDWWNKSYRGDVDRPGQHLANRAASMSTMMKDMLLMGNENIDALIPGNIRFARYMGKGTQTQEAAAAMYFFMLSHFIADSCMPCHCDARKLHGYDKGLHEELEGHWSKVVGTQFEKSELLGKLPDMTLEEAAAEGKELPAKARKVDVKFGLDFGQAVIGDLQKGHDVWLELIFICRATFAIASIMAPFRQYPYGSDVTAPFDTLFAQNSNLLKQLDTTTMYDAVLNTAIVWKHIWNKVSVD